MAAKTQINCLNCQAGNVVSTLYTSSNGIPETGRGIADIIFYIYCTASTINTALISESYIKILYLIIQKSPNVISIVRKI